MKTLHSVTKEYDLNLSNEQILVLLGMRSRYPNLRFRVRENILQYGAGVAPSWSVARSTDFAYWIDLAQRAGLTIHNFNPSMVEK